MSKTTRSPSREDFLEALTGVQCRRLEEKHYRILECILLDWACTKGHLKKNGSVTTESRPPGHADGVQPDNPEGKRSGNSDSGNEKKDHAPTPPRSVKGHGRRSQHDYPGAILLPIGFEHDEKKPPCCGTPDYEFSVKEHFVLVGFPPITGFLLQIETLKCSCGAVIRPARTPVDLLARKYHPSAVAMMTLLRHWYGVPNYRQEILQQQMGIPVPDATQSDLIKGMVDIANPIYRHLRETAAGAELLFLDDTGARIVSRIHAAKLEPDQKRTASHATGTVARTDHGPVCLYEIGANHAGENLDALLAIRGGDRPPPVIMNDGSSCNTCHSQQAIHLNCWFHFRQKIERCRSAFPEEVGVILDLIAQLYRNEAEGKLLALKDQTLLKFRRRCSGPMIAKLRKYGDKLLKDRLVEPNSNLGQAITYGFKRWRALTGFLRIENAPLDNNPAERLLKPFALIRKNSLFYKDPAGAQRAGILMSLAATAVAHEINPLLYFTAIYAHESDVLGRPELWLPWNFEARLASLEAMPSPALGRGRHSSAKPAFSGFPFHKRMFNSLAASSVMG